jgi:peptidoglycan/LPS O-acetylase OafA/YrhL
MQIESSLQIAAAPHREQSDSKKFEQLEGLRGIASVAVLLSHLRMAFFVDANEWATRSFGKIASIFIEAIFDGDFAVWLFWVMSAFVLSIRFHKCTDESSQISILRDAAIRRYPRLLLPVMASVLVAWSLHALGLMSNRELANQIGAETHSWLGGFYSFEPNFCIALRSALWSTFFAFRGSECYNNVLWTMEIEYYGSLFLFAYLALIGKHPARYFLYALTTFVIYALSLHWMNAFVLGIAIADLYVRRKDVRAFFPEGAASIFDKGRNSRLAAFSFFVPVLFGIGIQTSGTLHLTLAAVLTAYVLISEPPKQLLSSRVPVFLGKISFGLYLLHWPLICAAAFPIHSVLRNYVSGTFASLATSAILFVLSIIGGWLLWYVADRPAIEFSRKVAKMLMNLSKTNMPSSQRK